MGSAVLILGAVVEGAGFSLGSRYLAAIGFALSFAVVVATLSGSDSGRVPFRVGVQRA